MRSYQWLALFDQFIFFYHDSDIFRDIKIVISPASFRAEKDDRKAGIEAVFFAKFLARNYHVRFPIPVKLRKARYVNTFGGKFLETNQFITKNFCLNNKIIWNKSIIIPSYIIPPFGHRHGCYSPSLGFFHKQYI